MGEITSCPPEMGDKALKLLSTGKTIPQRMGVWTCLTTRYGFVGKGWIFPHFFIDIVTEYLL